MSHKDSREPDTGDECLAGNDEAAYWLRAYERLKSDWPNQLQPLGFPDWIEVSQYRLGSVGASVTGRIGLLGGNRKSIGFILYLSGGPKLFSEIDWGAESASCDLPGWVAFDADRDVVVLGSG